MIKSLIFFLILRPEEQRQKLIYSLYYKGLCEADHSELEDITLAVSDTSNDNLTLNNNSIPSFQINPPIASIPIRGKGVPSMNVQRLRFIEPGYDDPGLLVPGSILYLCSIPTLALQQLIRSDNYIESLKDMQRRDFLALSQLMPSDKSNSIMGLVTHSRMLKFLERELGFDFQSDNLHLYPVSSEYSDQVESSIIKQLELTQRVYPQSDLEPQILLVRAETFINTIQDPLGIS